ncbi:SpoIIE family protein phosphatase [Nonomuraea phyllanthi]|uniref:protein-serine/threonine phosphatase n=1 Tax=Nonomuraea phyllanthi TaxID=2219224 RepID=A0A5C4WE28_9ACTN|nr:SpoIIE family protein phosphatase [Nonomuraea phyllanthi]KAB8192990.1 SpoIIE family protein phosphatase [Nonomuraea phyllanthi]QFY11146.1 SpoIIE family protein phosphatase [Nonomuraea phyllanthi]
MGVPEDAGWSWAKNDGRPARFIDLCDAGMYVVDDRGRIIEVNGEAERLLGRTAEELLGRDAHDLLHRGKHGEPLPWSRCVMRRPLMTGGAAHGRGDLMERGDGSLLPISWMVTACRIGDGKLGALVLFSETEPAVRTAWSGERGAPASMSELDRLALLAETTTTLTSSLDEAETLRQLVHLVVPLLADWAIVDLFTEGGGVSRAAVVHYENGAVVHREDLEGPMPPVPQGSSMPLSRALRGVTATIAGPEDYQGPPDAEIAVVQRKLFQATGMHSACIAPIRGVREVVGALTLGRSRRTERFTPGDLLLVEDIARRAGLALDNARLYERQRRVAETMQRHLLPQLPRVSGLEMSACYVPAPHASQVGGDWYDAFDLSGDRLGLVIGDVVGHDLDAASGMAQVCNMLRAFAGEVELPPSKVVDQLDQAVARMTEDTMATVVYAVLQRLEDGRCRMRWTNAGHPPPLLVERDGRARFLDAGSGLMLGTGIPAERVDATIELPPESILVLYTDGLIESPSRTLDDGMSRLRRHAASLAQRPLSSVCQRLLSQVRPDDNDDDVAMLILRVPC